MSIPTTQKALVGSAKGAQISHITRPVPMPGHNEVLVKVTTAALNPHDELIRRTGWLIKSYPWIPANDIAGTVVKLGEGVTKYTLGDVVFGQTNWEADDFHDHSGAQEYALLRVEASAKVPAGFQDDDALTLPVNFFAAWFAIHDDSGLHLPYEGLDLRGNGRPFDFSKHDLLIVGGGSRVGEFTVQTAKLDGWRNVVVVAGMKNEENLKKMGATHVVDRHLTFDEQLHQIRNIVGDDLLYAVDAASTDFTLAVAALSNEKEGHMVNLAYGNIDRSKIGEKKSGFKESLTYGMCMKTSSIDMSVKVWDALPSWMEKGQVLIPKWTIIEGLDIDKVNETLDKYRDGRVVPEHVHIRP